MKAKDRLRQLLSQHKWIEFAGIAPSLPAQGRWRSRLVAPPRELNAAPPRPESEGKMSTWADNIASNGISDRFDEGRKVGRAEADAEIAHQKANYDELKRESVARIATLQSTMDALWEAVNDALNEASIFCLGCAKKENVVTPPRSGVVGLASVHSSGMICIPNTIRALLNEKLSTPASGEPARKVK